jgi:glycosyltransferase involved in cell wall biosynthesis
MMNIAIVVPYIPKIEGNRMAFNIARGLSADNDVTVISHTVISKVVNEVEELCKPVKLKYIRQAESGGFGFKFALKYQFLRGKSRDLANFILKSDKFDAIIVIANEGHWLPSYIKRKSNAKVYLILMELHDRGIISLQNSNAKKSIVKGIILSPIYGLLKYFERKRFSSFDLLFANSIWTKTIFEYLYGLPVSDVVFAIDTEHFKPSSSRIFNDNFIVVPTASLKNNFTAMETLKRLSSEGIRLVCYGSVSVPGVENLGYVDDDRMIQILSEASATLFLFNYEALGLIPFESLACGTPVITERKQGPGLQLSVNENVHFFNSYEELKELCIQLTRTGKTDAIKNSCRNSIMSYDYRKVADMLRSRLVQNLLVDEA